MSKTNRRNFLGMSILASLGAMVSMKGLAKRSSSEELSSVKKPLVLSTWEYGIAANEHAWKILVEDGTALDAVEAGVRVSESDPKVMSVGYGGLPDREGHVTLDACIMDHLGNCGSVAFLRDIVNPVSVARKVMERTPHIMLVGEGAFNFAIQNGFNKTNLLTPAAEQRWKKWKLENESSDKTIDKNNHDTIGMLAIDKNGDISGACTTSGLAWKYHGRVGDSPLIGAGLYIDNEIGGATATGKGEAVIKIAGSFLIVELMRQGLSPQMACEQAIERIIKKQRDYAEFQVGFLAVNKGGETGAFAISKGFQYAIMAEEKNQLIDSGFKIY